MKKTILKATIFCLAIGLSFTGCATVLDGGVKIPDSSIIEKNASIKLYYEDTNNTVIREDMKNLLEFLNKEEDKKIAFIPTKISVPNEPKQKILGLDAFDYEYIKNTENKILKLKFSLDANSNYIIVDKKYFSSEEVCADLLMISQYVWENVKGKTEVLDKLGTGSILYIDAKAMREGILKFTSKREVTRMILADGTKTAFTKAGYTMVNTPTEADMSIYFQITRDYLQSELKKLKDEGKSPTFGVTNAGLNNQINKMDIGMRLASTSNSSGTSVGAGLGIVLRRMNLATQTHKHLAS